MLANGLKKGAKQWELVNRIQKDATDQMYLGFNAADCRGWRQIVLLDVQLPGIDGPETLTQLRQIRPGLPVIVFSGYAQQDDVASIIQEGVSFLSKPFDVDDLLERIRSALS